MEKEMQAPKNAARLSRNCVAVLCLLLAQQSPAADLLIVNARLIDGTGAPPQDGVNILLSGGRVQSVGTAKIDAKGATLVDAQGKTVLPGLTDAHVHSSMEFPIPPEEQAPGFGFPDPKWGVYSDEKMRAYIDQSFGKHMRKYLESGVTSIVDPGTHFPWGLELRDNIRSGKVLGPRLYIAGRLFTAPGGHPASTVCNSDPWCMQSITVATDDPEVAREGVRTLAAAGVDGLKMVYDGLREDERESEDDDTSWEFFRDPLPHLKKEVMEAVIDEGHKQGLKVLAHTFAIADTADVVKAGIDGLVHSTTMDNGSYQTPDGEYLPALLNRFDVPMTTTIGIFGDAEEEMPDAPPEMKEMWTAMAASIGPSLRAMAEAGVTLVFGTDYFGLGIDPQPKDLLLNEARVLVKGGFSEMEVIQMATGNAAKHPLLPDATGTIAPGQFADLIVLNEDPLKNIDALFYPEMVVKAGEILIDNR